MSEFPNNEEELDELLTHPWPELVAFVNEIASPLVVLGAGGKMGPSLCVLAKRAAAEAGVDLDVVAVSRFGATAAREWLEAHGVQTASADLLDRSTLERLPDAQNVIYLVGMKFGTAANPSLTWAANTLAPTHAAERYAGSRIVALSTGNVYPLTDVAEGGSLEDDPLTPIGEYANAAVARERLFEHFSRQSGGPSVASIRLNYATELRYGVPVDIANKLLAGEPIDLRNGHFNCIWQGDANDMILRALALTTSPATAWNLTAPGVRSVRETALRLGELLGCEPKFTGIEATNTFLNNPARLCAKLGEPPTPFATILERTARWVKCGGPQHGKATHFEVRDGKF